MVRGTPTIRARATFASARTRRRARRTAARRTTTPTARTWRRQLRAQGASCVPNCVLVPCVKSARCAKRRKDGARARGPRTRRDALTVTRARARAPLRHRRGVAFASLANDRWGVDKCATTRVMAVKVLDDDGAGTFGDVLLALDFVVKQRDAGGLSEGRNVVASMSLSGAGTLQAIDDAILAAKQEGVLTVVSAGNQNGDACARTPARSAEALTVGSTDECACVQPGASILSAAPVPPGFLADALR